MASGDTDKEIRDIKRRLDLAETRLAQGDGRFEFIIGQLRDIQLYMHARFGDMDDHFAAMGQKFTDVNVRFDRHDTKIDRLDSKMDAMPRVIAELIANRS